MRILCSNGDTTIEFGYVLPYWLNDVSGLFGEETNVLTSDSATHHGGIYLGTHSNARNIVISAYVINNYLAARRTLEKLFSPETQGMLTYIDDREYSIDYYAESFEMSLSGRIRNITVSLICPDPLFKGISETKFLGGKRGLLTLPFTHHEPFMISEYYANDTVTIQNTNSLDTGMIIRIIINANGLPSNFNPTIVNVKTKEELTLNTHAIEGIIEWNIGDYYEISTYFGKKKVEFISGDTRTGVLSTWQAGNTWLQLHPGSNTFRAFCNRGTVQANIPLRYEFVSQQEYWTV